MMTTEIEKSIVTIWEDIESWYRENSPLLFGYLSDGATDKRIQNLENQIGLTLPDDYKQSLRRHDGGSLIHNYWYLSVADVKKRWKTMNSRFKDGKFPQQVRSNEMNGVIQNQWWNVGWIPIAEHIGGLKICIDLVPAEKGTSGQILEFDIQEGPSVSRYKSFLSWLQGFRDDLVDGNYGVNEAGYLVVK